MHLTECDNLNEEIPPKNLFQIENYFDEPSLGVFEDDWVNVEELENL